MIVPAVPWSVLSPTSRGTDADRSLESSNQKLESNSSYSDNISAKDKDKGPAQQEGRPTHTHSPHTVDKVTTEARKLCIRIFRIFPDNLTTRKKDRGPPEGEQQQRQQQQLVSILITDRELVLERE